MPKVPKIGNA